MATNLRVTVTESDILSTPATPPTPGTGSGNTIAAATIAGGVRFTWDARRSIGSWYYQYKLKVGSGGWDVAWSETTEKSLERFLTEAERLADGYDASIYLQIRLTDGSSPSAIVGDDDTVTAQAGSLGILLADIDNLDDIPVASLAADATDRMFDDNTRSLDDVAQGSTNKLLTAGELVGAQNAETHLDADGLKGTAEIGGTTASTVVSNASDGKDGYDKIVSDVGADTLEDVTGSQAKVDTRFSATEKATLELALGETLTNMAGGGDVILMAVGTSKNLVANKASIKTDLDLNNVENKSGATLVADEVDDTFLTSVDGTINSTVVASVNASSEVALLQHKLNSSYIYESGGITPVFDTSGRLLTSIYDGGTQRDVADIVSATDASGRATNLDLTTPSAGQTFDDLPDGSTYKKCTVNQQTGAGRAYTDLQAASGGCSAGIFDAIAGLQITAAELRKRWEGRRSIHSDIQEAQKTIGGDFTVDSISTAGLEQQEYLYSFVYCEGDAAAYFQCQAMTDTGTPGELKLRAYSYVAGALSLKATGSAEAMVLGAMTKLTASVVLSGFSDGDTVVIEVGINDGGAATVQIKGKHLYIGVD